MLISQVKKLSPLQRLLYFISEREAVRLAKEAGEPKPWTDDVILQSYRFCNIRRMDDKVSKWLYENWYKSYFGHNNMLLAVALARFINKPETLEYVGFPSNWEPKRLIAKLRKWRDLGNVVFNGAYMVRGNDGQDKIECVVEHYVQPLKGLQSQLNTDSMEESHAALCRAYGFGSFMAGQVVADLRWAMDGKWLDRMSWAPIGPGSKKGMNYLHGSNATANLPQGKFLSELLLLMQECEDSLPDSITNRLEAMDYQNCLCEYRAYHQALEEIKNPKRRYAN